MRLSLRDLFWLILVAAVITTWWIDHSKLADQLAFYQTPKPAVTLATVTAVVVATNNGDLLEVSVGSDDGVKAGQTMKLSRGNQHLGTITIRTISPDRAVGQLDKSTQRAKIRKGDTATTQIQVMHGGCGSCLPGDLPTGP
jgi:hypothetical protein